LQAYGAVYSDVPGSKLEVYTAACSAGGKAGAAPHTAAKAAGMFKPRPAEKCTQAVHINKCKKCVIGSIRRTTKALKARCGGLPQRQQRKEKRRHHWRNVRFRSLSSAHASQCGAGQPAQLGPFGQLWPALTTTFDSTQQQFTTLRDSVWRPTVVLCGHPFCRHPWTPRLLHLEAAQPRAPRSPSPSSVPLFLSRPCRREA
jgi:hypothetical protein